MDIVKFYGSLFILAAALVIYCVVYKGMKEGTVYFALQSRDRPCSTNEENEKYVHTVDIKCKNLERRFRLNQACTDQNTPQHTLLDPDKIQHSVWVESKHAILYCGIPKVGTTFWKRTLTVLASESNYSSPFQLKPGNMNLINFYNLKNKLSGKRLHEILKDSTSFIFVRDPYSRLFSGYEHKLYYPNLNFWKSHGMPIVRSIRMEPANETLQFGHDVKFAEFVQYILKQNDNNENINGHFKPLYKKCDPCSLPYDFIGHLETFKQDAEYLFDKWRKKFPDFNLHFDDFEKETALDTARDLVHRLFRSWNKIKNRINYPFYNLVLRVWSDLQIRGYLSKDISLPFLPKDMKYLSPEKMMKAVSDALEIQVNNTAVKLQRHDALKQAYDTVSLHDMERLRNFVLKDCQLFGYDDRPSFLFDRTNKVDNKHLYMAGI